MGLWQRISTLFKSNINHAISQAEDPEKILNQMISDMRSEYTEARKQVATAIADEKKLKKKYEEEQGNTDEWEKRARKAVQAERDDLARQALERKNQHEQTAEQYKQQWQAQKEQADQLREQLNKLNQKIEEAQRKKGILIARQKRAEAQKKIQDTMSGLDDSSAFDTFSKMEDKVDRMEAEADASQELSESPENVSLEQQFDQLEDQTGQDDELAQLKAEMGGNQGALPNEGASEESSDTPSEAAKSEVDAELEELVKEEKK